MSLNFSATIYRYMNELSIKHFYGCYYIGNPNANEYLMLDLGKRKVTVLDEIQYNIIQLLAEIKADIRSIN